MRLLERTRKDVWIAPRCETTGALGGVKEGFAPERRLVRGSVIPSTGGVVSRESGLMQPQSMCLLLPMDAGLNVGDGVCLDGGEIRWRCVNVERWSAHVAAQVERIC